MGSWNLDVKVLHISRFWRSCLASCESFKLQVEEPHVQIRVFVSSMV